MGLINSVGTGALKAIGLNTDRSVTPPPGPDFESFDVQELVNGDLKDVTDGKYGIRLNGSFMPHVPFEFGGSQKLVKDYYPGSKEPTVQVLGPQENDLTIKGRLHLKRLNTPNSVAHVSGIEDLAHQYQKQLDEIRLRGNLLKLTMGDWVRWAFLEEVKFTLNRKVDIDYELKFMIVGFTKPVNGLFTVSQKDGLTDTNAALIQAAQDALAAIKTYPSTMPRTLSEFLNDKIGQVANVVAVVTGFVDGIVGDAQSLLNSANRALGMIKYARAYISKTIRDIGQIAATASSLGTSFTSEAQKTSATIRNAKHLNDTKNYLFSLATFLAALQLKYQAIAASTPFARYLVKQGDTLQKISIHFYGTADNWKKIYDHNQLTSTALTVGVVLEIPK